MLSHSPLDPRATAELTAALAPRDDWPDIPGYKITGEIARGGMGRVLAGRELTLDREVAIKLLLPGADSERFVTEAKVTARLPHPNVPPVYALGALADGSPYLAMKLVRGRTLSAELEARSSIASGLPRFVQVFEQICQAVGLAHAQGVLHRDLKPSNVILGAFGEVQVMDWGLAKLQVAGAAPAETKEAARSPGQLGETIAWKTADKSTGAASHTHSGEVLGTPAYMPPEQARGEAVDARADVFALGGILYSILTGRPVYAAATAIDAVKLAAGGNLADANQRLDKCGADAELVALARRCLSARAADRPPNGHQVAALVGAYRASVEDRLRQAEKARAASDAKTQEQIKRRRIVQVAAAALAAVLLLGIAGTSAGLVAANRARSAETKRADGEQRAKLASQESERKESAAKVAEREQRTKAEKRLKQIANGNEVITSIFDDLDIQKVRAGNQPLERVLADRLLKAAAQLERDSVGEAMAVSELQVRLGGSLISLGFASDAIPLLEKCLATREQLLPQGHLGRLTCMSSLALAYRQAGQTERALRMFRETADLCTAHLTKKHPLTITANIGLADCYRSSGQVDRSRKLNEETLDIAREVLGEDHSDTLVCLNGLASDYLVAGDKARALELYQRHLELTTKSKGPDNPKTLTSAHNLARVYADARQLDQAIPLLKRTLERSRAILSNDHPGTIDTMVSLAACYFQTKEFEPAIKLYEEALQLRKQKPGEGHPSTIATMYDLAAAYSAWGKHKEALPHYQRAFELRQAKDADDPETLKTMNSLGVAYWRDKQFDKSVPLYEELVKRSEAKYSRSHVETLSAIGNLGVNYKDAGRVSEALPLLIEAYDAAERFPRLRFVSAALWNACVKANDVSEAKKRLPALVAEQRTRLATDRPGLATQLSNFGTGLLQLKDYAAAENLLRESLTIRQNDQPNWWITFSTQAYLGEALLRQENYAAAEEQLILAHDGMKQRESQIPPASKVRLIHTIDRLIALYTATQKPDEVVKWQAERAKRTAPQAVAPGSK